MNARPPFFAEVIASSLWEWSAQSWQWQITPAYGQLVVVETTEYQYFGFVAGIQTGALDGLRVPVAYQKTEQELLQAQPQIFEFLKTNFTCALAGYAIEQQLWYVAPPLPPKLHAFVRPAQPAELQQFFQNYQFLHLLFSSANAAQPQVDELLLAIFQRGQAVLDLRPSLPAFAQLFANLVGRDYQRLRRFLGRLETVLAAKDLAEKSA